MKKYCTIETRNQRAEKAEKKDEESQAVISRKRLLKRLLFVLYFRLKFRTTAVERTLCGLRNPASWLIISACISVSFLRCKHDYYTKVHMIRCRSLGQPRFDWIFFFFFSHTLTFFPASGQAVVTGVLPSPPRFLPSIFIADRVQQSHCSSIVHRELLTHALALSASQFVHKKKSHEFIRVCTRRGSNSRN